MQPTPLGTATLAYARRSLADLTRFAADLESKRRGGHGQLTVGAIMGAAPDVLAMAVAELKSERPLLNVRILGETSDQVVQLLHRREVDLALGRLTTPLQHNDFDFEPLAREAMRLVVRAKHPLAGKRAACARLRSSHGRGFCNRSRVRRAVSSKKNLRARGFRRRRTWSNAHRSSRRCNCCKTATPSRCCLNPSCATICVRSC